jgi:hypothetical protein
VAETKCPKCSGELRFMPPERPPEVVSWIGGELAGWVVFAATAGAIGCVLTDRHAIAAGLGVVAAIGVFLLLERLREEPAKGPGLFHCPNCQYYFKPERLNGGTSAI